MLFACIRNLSTDVYKLLKYSIQAGNAAKILYQIFSLSKKTIPTTILLWVLTPFYQKILICEDNDLSA